MDKRFIPALIVVLAIFLAIVSVTGIVGTYFGKTAEIVLLVLIAAVLVVMLLINRNNNKE